MQRKTALIGTTGVRGQKEFKINYVDNMGRVIAKHRYMSMPLVPEEFIYFVSFQQDKAAHGWWCAATSNTK